MRDYKNILVIQTAFIGDAILSSSLIEKLHRRFPGAKVSVLVRKGNEGIFREHPFLTDVLTWDKKKGKFGNLLRLLLRIRKNKFDCVVNCHRYGSSGFLTAFSGARHTCGYKENPFSFLFNHTTRHIIGDGRHETERYNELVADFAGDTLFPPKLYPSPSDFETVRRYKEIPYLCMAPASVWKTKALPAEKWVELCRQHGKRGRIYLLGGLEDRALCEQIRAACPGHGIENLAGMLTLLESCALMRDAVENFVNDSAPLHLASAVNAPVTAFFCSTVPAFGFGPLSERSRTIGVENLPCRPCGIHGYHQCPLGHFRCGHDMPLP